jgi:hypothetical protein
LTALANTEPVVGAQRKEAQSLQWFLSESGWDPKEVNRRRVKLRLKDPKSSAPSADGVLVIDEHGDRKWGKHTARVGRQWLANIGKTESGVVSVSSLLADESVYSRVFICGRLWSSTAVAVRRTIRAGRAEGHELAPDLDGGIGVGVTTTRSVR